MNEYLPRAVLFRLLAVLALVLGPHLTRVPLWAALLVVAVILWRALASLRQWRPLGRMVRIAIALLAFVGVYASYGRTTGQTAGVGLLTVMAAIKLLEMYARRDVMVMVLLMYFLLVTHFLFSQEIWTIAYLLVCAVLITGLLIEANHPNGALPLGRTLRMSLRLVVSALPLMAVFFVLFPRIPGPIWGLPSDSGAARSGLSDDMAPGDIASLIESDAVSFRVSFDGNPPPNNQRYWRGPVLDYFDGRTWSASRHADAAAAPKAELEAPAYSYEVTLEPQRRRWLFALDLPELAKLPGGATVNRAYELLSRGDIKDRLPYRLVSHPRYRLEPELPPEQRARFLQLPPGYNPRSLALAQSWREQGLDDTQVIKAALSRFREENYYYTLEPPMLGRDSVDDFLFETKRGFCEHYASSFTVLMRAAGIPARVVTGYQGGEHNELGNYYVVYQSDAHAWSEVWLEGEGWTRADPTAAVAPQRVEEGIRAALAGTGELPSFLDPNSRGYNLRLALTLRWDWMNAQWNQWVLGYGPQLQNQLMRQLGLMNWSNMIIALTVAVGVILGLLGTGLTRQFLPKRSDDPALRLWQKALKRLRRAGLPARPEEGPRDYAARVAAQRPDLAEVVQRVSGAYLRLRYLAEPDEQNQRELAAAVAALRP